MCRGKTETPTENCSFRLAISSRWRRLQQKRTHTMKICLEMFAITTCLKANARAWVCVCRNVPIFCPSFGHQAPPSSLCSVTRDRKKPKRHYSLIAQFPDSFNVNLYFIFLPRIFLFFLLWLDSFYKIQSKAQHQSQPPNPSKTFRANPCKRSNGIIEEDQIGNNNKNNNKFKKNINK